ncbi:hypothetical protein [Butyricimonas faecalis]|uniref:hypothetical protein n=1 Tax=Butyricimonas faecalis TaxID=2093856 RepID=UPI001E596118|nr:hypothetical protein [Butyricimonas faecalis]
MVCLRPPGGFFCFQKVVRDNRTRLIRKNTLDKRRGRFLRVTCGGTPALAGLERPVTFAEKFCPIGRTAADLGLMGIR